MYARNACARSRKESSPRRDEGETREKEGDEGDRRDKEGPGGPGMANGGAVRPTQTGPRFKAPGPARYISFRLFLGYDHLPSSRPCNTFAFTTKRHRHARTGTHIRGRVRENTRARVCVYITACGRICFDHIPSSRIIGSAMYRVFLRDSSGPCALCGRESRLEKLGQISRDLLSWVFSSIPRSVEIGVE